MSWPGLFQKRDDFVVGRMEGYGEAEEAELANACRRESYLYINKLRITAAREGDINISAI